MQRPKLKQAQRVVLGTACLALVISTRPALGQTEPEANAEQAQTDTKVEETPTETQDTTASEAAPSEQSAETPPADTPPADTAPAETTEPPATTGSDSANVEELYITGSRIKRVDLTTPAPVTVLTRQDLDSTGKQSIGDILQALPAQSNGINTQVNNGGDGSTRVNLRGLGSQRTLVLVNGRRMVNSGTGADPSVDLNTIPAEIIERVEILKDGASSVYGSDAISGVVNIITKKAFSGLELNTYMGGTSNGGFLYTLGATAGQRAEKGGFLLSFQWLDASDILASQREYTNKDLEYDYYAALHPGKDADGDGITDVPDPTSTGGSSSVPEGYYRVPRTSIGNSRWEKLKAANPTGAAVVITKDPKEGYRGYRNTGLRDVTCVDPVSGESGPCGDAYNYQPENYIVTPSKRINLWGHGDYELTKRATAYFEASYNNRRSSQLLAPEPFFGDQEGIALTADNVYNPFGVDIPGARRRLVEFSNRIFEQSITTYRTVLGVNGTFADEGFFSSWSWDANFIYGRSDGVSTKQGSLVLHKLSQALGPSYFDQNGTAVCGTPNNPVAEACTPLNLFGGPGSITQDQVRGLTYDGTATGFSMQRLVNLTTGGSLFELWNRPVGLALGYAFRREDGGFQPDPLTAAGDTTGAKGESTGGGYSENAAFAEIDVPLLADLPAIQLLEGSFAIRGFDFSTFGNGATYKLGGRWQVFEHLALRATYSTAFRAPSIQELYAGAADSFPDVIDPCSTEGRNRTAEQQANCKADGLPDDLPDDRLQLLSQVGGNSTLDAERAKTWTAGLVITPKGNRFIDGLSLTLDVYDIRIENAIVAKGAEVIINNCYNFSSRTDCEKVHRDASGLVQLVDDLNTNVGGNDTMGFDVGLVYSLPTDVGTFRFNFDGNLLAKFDQIQANRTVSGRGVYDLEAVYSPVRFNTGIGWGFEGITAGFATRYTAGFTECENNDCSTGARDSFAEAAQAASDPNSPSYDPMYDDTLFHERKVSAYAVSDLYAGYSFSSSLGYTSVQAGVNNLFNTPPPRIYNGFSPNSDPTAYDFLGRFFYVGLRHSL